MEEEEQLPEIVDKPSNLHPLGFAIATDGLSGLEQMFDLRHAGLCSEKQSASAMFT